METWERLSESIGTQRKEVANKLGLGKNLIHKWCEGYASGKKIVNPLDRILTIIEVTGSQEIIEYLCAQCEGYYVKNTHEADSVPSTNRILSEVGDVIKVITKAEADNFVDSIEILQIEESLNKLKAVGDGFIRDRKKELKMF